MKAVWFHKLDKPETQNIDTMWLVSSICNVYKLTYIALIHRI